MNNFSWVHDEDTGIMTFDGDYDEYQEKYIEICKDFENIWKTVHIADCNELNSLKNLETKCYFGRGSHPSFINSWQVKTNALLYDTFIFDTNVFRNTVIGWAFLPSELEDSDGILKYTCPIDFSASSFLMNLYKNGHVRIVNSINIWNNMFQSDVCEDLDKKKMLYSDPIEIKNISKNAAIFPGDESNYPHLLHMMNEDILASYIMDSSIITQEYSYYIKRKLDKFSQVKSKYNIINQLLKYEVPNFDSLDYSKIEDIRNLRSLSNLRAKLEEASQNIGDNPSDVESIVQIFKKELWDLALDNIEDNKTKVIIESIISNVPYLSNLISARNLLKVEKLQKHWGYTILHIKKN